MNDNFKGFSFKLKLIQVTLFDPSQQEGHFTLSIINKNHQYNTSPFRLINKTIDLKQCAPIYINMQENKQSLLKITLNSCQDSSSFDTQIDYKVIQIIINKGRKPEGKKRRHILAFPLFGRSRNIVGQIKVKLSILPTISHEKTVQQVNSNQKKANRQIVFSKYQDEDYFQPIYSRFFKVKIDNNKEESDQNINDRKQQPIPPTQQRPSIKSDSFEPFKEEISLIQLRDSNQGRLNQQQQCEMVELANTANQKIKQDRYQQPQEIVDIPEDCRYLFQKINEINKRYAPLQRIPSQEQFSDYSELNQGDNRMDSDFEEEQVSHPLQQVEQLLKQLDLIKFAQTLQQSEDSKS